MGVLDVARQGRFSKMPEPPIVLVPHDPRWARPRCDHGGMRRLRARDASRRQQRRFPAIAVKPVVDMMPRLRRHHDGFACLRWQR